MIEATFSRVWLIPASTLAAQAGIIDPTKVVRTALADAVSVASLMTTTEVWSSISAVRKVWLLDDRMLSM